MPTVAQPMEQEEALSSAHAHVPWTTRRHSRPCSRWPTTGASSLYDDAEAPVEAESPNAAPEAPGEVESPRHRCEIETWSARNLSRFINICLFGNLFVRGRVHISSTIQRAQRHRQDWKTRTDSSTTRTGPDPDLGSECKSQTWCARVRTPSLACGHPCRPRPQSGQRRLVLYDVSSAHSAHHQEARSR